jgi:hypothetical protein
VKYIRSVSPASRASASTAFASGGSSTDRRFRFATSERISPATACAAPRLLRLSQDPAILFGTFSNCSHYAG